MKKSDLGVIMLHWMLVAALLGAVASGLCLWDKGLQARAAFLFEPDYVGVIHIGLSAAVVAILFLYFVYLKHKNFLSGLTLRLRLANGAVHWKRVNVMFYWILFGVIAMETITGILLTKLINQDVLARIFGIQRSPLLFLHLFLVAPILVFPIAHVAVHWLDGGHRKIFSIFRPRVSPRRPSLAVIMLRLKAENTRLKEERNERAARSPIDHEHSPG